MELGINFQHHRGPVGRQEGGDRLRWSARTRPMRCGVVSGFLLVFILSLKDVTLAYFLFTADSFRFSMWLF